MQMMNATMVSQTTPAAGTGASAAGTTGAAANTAAFGSLLVQVMGASASGQATAGGLPDLLQLLAGLIAQAPADEASDATGEVDAQGVTALLNQLSEQPELLDQLLNSEEMQGWLMQAAMLLQGMQILSPQDLEAYQEGTAPEAAADLGALAAGYTAQAGNAGVEAAPVTDAQAGKASAESAGMNRQQALAVLNAFTQAVTEQPDNVFMEQLREKLAEIVKAGSPSQAGDSLKKPSHPSDSKGVYVHDLAGKIQTVTVASHASKLQMLAAKSMPVNRLEALTGSAEQASATEPKATAGTGAGEEKPLPAGLAQDVNRLVSHKTVLPPEGVVRADSVAEDMSKFLLGKLRVQTGNGVMEARLTLRPESFGQVDVKLTIQNGQLVAQFAAQTMMGKDALEAQLSQLRMALQSQGIQVEKMEVTHSPSLQSGMFQGHNPQQQSQQFTRRNSSNPSREGNEEYAAEAAAILNGSKQPLLDGFDVTA